MSNNVGPVKSSERYIILDIIRGIALFGICLANYPEFSLYTFQKEAVAQSMPTAGIDHLLRYFHYLLIDGKFYTLFSLLFGIGFSIIIYNNAQRDQNGFPVFYRRMFILALIGFLHLMFLWSGDILLLYALLGLLLPLFRNVSDKKLLITSAILIFFPVVVEVLKVTLDFNPSDPVIRATQYFNEQNGITDDNFPIWLRDGKSYSDVLKFTVSGAFIRCQEFIDGNRIFKVLGLFLFGLYIGRHRIYARLDDYCDVLKKIRYYGFLWGFPASCLFAWNEVNHHPTGLIASALIYAISVIPLSFAYASTLCLWYMNHRERRVFRIMAAPGRMALSNYIGQSAIGMILFYGIGFQLAVMGLVYTELIAIGVFVFQILFSLMWLRYFQFGPMEWIWRMLTYGKWLKIRK